MSATWIPGCREVGNGNDSICLRLYYFSFINTIHKATSFTDEGVLYVPWLVKMYLIQAYCAFSGHHTTLFRCALIIRGMSHFCAVKYNRSADYYSTLKMVPPPKNRRKNMWIFTKIHGEAIIHTFACGIRSKRNGISTVKGVISAHSHREQCYSDGRLNWFVRSRLGVKRSSEAHSAIMGTAGEMAFASVSPLFLIRSPLFQRPS